MKILCITGDLNVLESNNLLNSTVIIGLIKNKHTVDILTFKNLLRVESSPLIRIIYLKGNKKYFEWLKSTKLKMLYLLWVNILGYTIIRPYRRKQLDNFILNQYDIVLSFCPPPLSALIAHDINKLGKNSKIRYIQFWSDPLTIGMCDSIENLPKRRLLHKFVENKILDYANEIVYCSPILCKTQKKLFPKHANKMRWSDVSYLERGKTNFSKGVDTIIRVGYFGDFTQRVRNIFPLIESISSMKNVKLVIRGNTDVTINKEKYHNIDIKTERFPYEQIEELENSCDILVGIGNIKGVQIPGKIFYYVNYNKPIIYIGDGAYNDEIISYLSQFNRFIFCHNNPMSIRNAICEAIENLSKFSLFIHPRLMPENSAAKIINDDFLPI